MRTIEKLADVTEKRIYVCLTGEETRRAFIEQAEKEGYTFTDGVKPSEREVSDFYAINKDKTLNYISTAGRIAWQLNHRSIRRVDFKAYISGAENYII